MFQRWWPRSLQRWHRARTACAAAPADQQRCHSTAQHSCCAVALFGTGPSLLLAGACASRCWLLAAAGRWAAHQQLPDRATEIRDAVAPREQDAGHALVTR
eukprot:COSAG01_NODE_56_length_31088_cov_39.354771_14_plen_101_part_00